MTHRFPVRIHYEDTDLSGFVYHANYLRFCERGRSDWVAGLGIDQGAMREGGLVFAVVAMDCRFLAPARLGDDLTVETVPLSAGGVRAVLDQRVTRGEAALFAARVTLVCMTAGGRPRRLPEALRQAPAVRGD